MNRILFNIYWIYHFIVVHHSHRLVDSDPSLPGAITKDYTSRYGAAAMVRAVYQYRSISDSSGAKSQVRSVVRTVNIGILYSAGRLL